MKVTVGRLAGFTVTLTVVLAVLYEEESVGVKVTFWLAVPAAGVVAGLEKVKVPGTLFVPFSAVPEITEMLRAWP